MKKRLTTNNIGKGPTNGQSRIAVSDQREGYINLILRTVHTAIQPLKQTEKRKIKSYKETIGKPLPNSLHDFVCVRFCIYFR